MSQLFRTAKHIVGHGRNKDTMAAVITEQVHWWPVFGPTMNPLPRTVDHTILPWDMMINIIETISESVAGPIEIHKDQKESQEDGVATSHSLTMPIV